MGATLFFVTTRPTSDWSNICFFCGFKVWQSQDFWPYNRPTKTINPGSEARVQNWWQARPEKIFCAVKWERNGPVEQRPGVSRGLANSTWHLFGIKSVSDSGEPESLQLQSPLQSLMRRNYWFVQEVFLKLKDANVSMGRIDQFNRCLKSQFCYIIYLLLIAKLDNSHVDFFANGSQKH